MRESLRTRSIEHLADALFRPFNLVAARILARFASSAMKEEAKYVLAGTYFYRRHSLSDSSNLEILSKALIAGEDRRFQQHAGMDLKAILRAAVSIVRGRIRQGGSTIEQQLVRTIRNRYEFSISRKLSEIALACYVSKEIPKKEILRAYLGCAYFGAHASGIRAILKRLDINQGDMITVDQACSIVAHLRYPLTSRPSARLAALAEGRAKRIRALMGEVP